MGIVEKPADIMHLLETWPQMTTHLAEGMGRCWRGQSDESTEKQEGGWDKIQQQLKGSFLRTKGSETKSEKSLPVKLQQAKIELVKKKRTEHG